MEYTDYNKLADNLRADSDAQVGIVSQLNEGGEWVRDATHAVALENRTVTMNSGKVISVHEAPHISANNMLLRSLSRLRAIDYAIEKAYPSSVDPEKGIADNTRDSLKQQFGVLVKKVEALRDSKDEAALEALKKLEKSFNRVLIEKLHDAGLTDGIKNGKEAEKLLNYYRNLSSLLQPARTMVTVTYDEAAKVRARETAYSITQKTAAQKALIENLETLPSYQSHRPAMQKADSLFKALMLEDDRAMPAQTRKTHLVGGLKNAFLVKNELIFEDESGEPQTETRWGGRMATPVYVGKGEKPAAIQAQTRENMEQFRQAEKEIRGLRKPSKIHVTTLNTKSMQENQHVMIEHLEQATRKNSDNEDDYSYAPLNFQGKFDALNVAEGVEKPIEKSYGSSVERAESDAEIVLNATKAGFLSVINCASGQDRTGIITERAKQKWIKDMYQEHGKQFKAEQIETISAKGGHAAEITTHHVHGSPGIKVKSKVQAKFKRIFSGQLFSEPVGREFHRKSADTNKKSPVEEVACLQTVGLMAETSYRGAAGSFLHAEGHALLVAAKALPAKEGKEVLETFRAYLEEPEDIKRIEALIVLAKKVSGHARPEYQVIAKALLTFAAASLFVGVLAGITVVTGGAPLLLGVGVVTGMGMLKVAACFTAGAATLGIGSSVLKNAAEEKGVASQVSKFKNALFAMKHAPEDQDTSDNSEDEPGPTRHDL